MVNTSTLVACQGKPMWDFLHQDKPWLRSWYVLTVFNSTPDNIVRLELLAQSILTLNNKDLLYVTNTRNDKILDHHPTGCGEGSHMRKDQIKNTI